MLLAAAAALGLVSDILSASLPSLDAHEALTEGVKAEHNMHVEFVLHMFKQVGVDCWIAYTVLCGVCVCACAKGGDQVQLCVVWAVAGGRGGVQSTCILAAAERALPRDPHRKLLPCLLCVYTNKKDGIGHVCVHVHVCEHVFLAQLLFCPRAQVMRPLQVARCMAAAWPYFPDPLAITNVLQEQQDSARAAAAARPPARPA